MHVNCPDWTCSFLSSGVRVQCGEPGAIFYPFTYGNGLGTDSDPYFLTEVMEVRCATHPMHPGSCYGIPRLSRAEAEVYIIMRS